MLNKRVILGFVIFRKRKREELASAVPKTSGLAGAPISSLGNRKVFVELAKEDRGY